MTYLAADDRYERMTYRRVGRSGIKLPLISLGLWHNFGEDRPLDGQRAILRRAFDLGVTHFDLANNMARPTALPRRTSARSISRTFCLPRRAVPVDQGRMGHVARALRRPRLEQVPKALYAGISYSPQRTAEAARILRELGTPLFIHQPSYSLLNRWIEDELLDTAAAVGAGVIVFSPLAQGMLTAKYLDGCRPTPGWQRTPRCRRSCSASRTCSASGR